MGRILFEDEWINHLIMLFLFIFLLIAYNQTLGMIYISIVIFSYLVFINPNFTSSPMVRSTGSWIMRLILSGVLYLAFIWTISSLFSILGYEDHSSPLSIIKLTASSMPVLAQSLIITILTFSILIPITETRAWARLMELIAYKFRINLEFNLLNPLIWAVVIIGGMAAVWFHVQAKGITNTPALIAVFVFFTYGNLLVLYFREVIIPVLVHIWSNLIATLYQKGIFSFGETGEILLGANITLPYVILIGIIGYFVWKQGWLKRIGETI